MKGTVLLDKSAIARWARPEVAAVLDPLHQRGLLAICAPTVYELTFSARGKADAVALARQLRSFGYLRCDDEEFDRALGIHQQALAVGIHRALSLADLLQAAVAERHGVPVLHYDGDFDMIADLAGLSTRWVAEPGSIP